MNSDLLKHLTQIGEDHFEIYFSFQDPLTGKQRRLRRRFRGSLVEAIAFRDDLKTKALAGVIRPPVRRSTKALGEYLDPYMTYRKEVMLLSEGSLYKDRIALEKHILPEAGSWLPEGIRERHIRELITSLMTKEKRGGGLFSLESIKTYEACFLRFLTWVFREVELDPSWLKVMDLPSSQRALARRGRRRKRRGRALSPDEAQRLLEALRGEREQHNRPWFALTFVLLATGQRFGSVTALRWKDLDRERKIITFATSQNRGSVSEGSKTGEILTLPLSEELLEVLDDHKKMMVKMDHPGLKTGLVFPSSKRPHKAKFGGFMTSSGLSLALRRACEKVEIPRITPHDLRRTFNSWALEAGIEGSILRSITGHSSSAMTDHYYHGSARAKGMVQEKVLGLITIEN